MGKQLQFVVLGHDNIAFQSKRLQLSSLSDKKYIKIQKSKKHEIFHKLQSKQISDIG